MLATSLLRRASLYCAILLLGIAGCTPATPPGTSASADSSDQARATVIGVDKARRALTLRAPDGRTGQLVVSSAVRNFDQIAVGDTVRVTTYSHVTVTTTGNTALPATIAEGAVTAPSGSKPAGIFASRMQRSVQIVSVDRIGHTVTFREPDGSVDSFTVQNPANFAMADGLRPGSYVTVVATDAVAVSVDKI